MDEHTGTPTIETSPKHRPKTLRANRPRDRMGVRALVLVAGLTLVVVSAAACESSPGDLVEATINRGVLSVRGTDGPDTLTLKLPEGDPGRLEIDVHDDGLRDFAFDRAHFDTIRVEGFDGDDVLVVDEANGVFTDTERTTLVGGFGRDTIVDGQGPEPRGSTGRRSR